ncbi:Molybdenum ABC transporter, substrate-binding protein ModA [hydrothermal vent metagenome]|uniref:Molybdenum ABC transporter, substrate-binding protein ModA n=1 Tax=hydrothermal vent metagenome TaxID=652676 RepID=A0A3B1C687_9ZZZZ
MKICKIAVFSSLLLALLAGEPVFAVEVRIAVAANFTGVSRKIAPLFEKISGYHTRISYGSTGKLFVQIENGAPFDVFLAADSLRPIKAQNEGLAVAGTRFIYARGKLVLWSAKPGAFDDGEAYLQKSAFRHLAIANPKTAPYGLAAQQVLMHLGVWQTIQPRLVRGESIAQTFQFVATGNAEAGLVAWSQVRAWKRNPGAIWIIPGKDYAPIEQAAVLLKRGKDNPAAQAYLRFLRSAAARKLIEDAGYAVK